MSYCPMCGSYIPDASRTCPACGRPKFNAEESSQAYEKKAYQGASAAKTAAERSHRQKQANTESGKTTQWRYDTQSWSGDMDERAYEDFGSQAEDSTGDQNLFAALGYLGPLVLLPLIAHPHSTYVRFHANQSLGILLLFILCNIAVFLPFGGLISMFGNIFTVYGIIKGMHNALRGRMDKLPIVGDFKILGKSGGKK